MFAFQKKGTAVAYRPPKLTVYGTMTQLTASGSGTRSEVNPAGNCTGSPSRVRC
jgi:hypothetical protein